MAKEVVDKKRTAIKSVDKDIDEETLEVKEVEPTQSKVTKSEILCSIEEFIMTKSLRTEYVEGFKAYMGSTRYQREVEWEKNLFEFQNRKL